MKVVVDYHRQGDDNNNNNNNNKKQIKAAKHDKNKKTAIYVITISALLLLLSSTFAMSNITKVVSAISADPKFPDLKIVNSGKPPSTDNFNLSKGYIIEPVMWNLTLPSSVAFDNKGNMYIAESGYAYGGFTPQPKILKVEKQTGNTSILIDRMLNAPVTDIEFNKNSGLLYVSHRGTISTINPINGLIKDIIIGLPLHFPLAHYNNQIAFGPDGKLYVGIGTITNTGVVEANNFLLGGLKLNPKIHDIPGKNITLTGQNFETPDFLSEIPKNITIVEGMKIKVTSAISGEPIANATTGAFVPFGNITEKGQIIKGDVKCNGCIIRANADGSNLELVAWGLRNPYGLAFSNDGNRLFASDNGIDDNIGSIQIAKNDSDKFREIKLDELGSFHGWSDFAGNAEPITDPKFKPVRGPQPQFLMQDHPAVEKPLSLIGDAIGATQVDFSNGSKFGLQDMAFIGEHGTLSPSTHHPMSVTPANNATTKEEIVGQKVIMLDIENGNYSDFVSLDKPDLSFRPVGIAFNQDEGVLYIASIGKGEIRKTMPNGTPLPTPVPWYYPHTGVIWKVVKSDIASTGNGNITTISANTDAAINNMTTTSTADATANNNTTTTGTTTIQNKTSIPAQTGITTTDGIEEDENDENEGNGENGENGGNGGNGGNGEGNGDE